MQLSEMHGALRINWDCKNIALSQLFTALKDMEE